METNWKQMLQNSIRDVEELRNVGCIVRNQTVLLKGVNDHGDTLASLMNGLIANGVIPYYIFQCRPVQGVKNQFQVPLIRGIDIVENARKQMNGQAKSVRFAMSHPTGKIEILGKADTNKMVFKYHQAKYEKDHGRIFVQTVGENQCWLEETKGDCAYGTAANQ